MGNVEMEEEGKKWTACPFCNVAGDIDDMCFHDGRREHGYAHEDCIDVATDMCERCEKGNRYDCGACEMECFRQAVSDGKINLSSLIARNEIRKECDAIKKMLLEKNRKYGNSALDPVRVFSTASKAEQIRVRIDDKLSRMKNLQDDDNEDVVDDLIGYLILLKIAMKPKAESVFACQENG